MAKPTAKRTPPYPEKASESTQRQVLDALQSKVDQGEKLALSGELCMLITQELSASIQQAQLLQSTLLQSCDHWFKALSMGMSQQAAVARSVITPEEPSFPPAAEQAAIRFRKKDAQVESHDWVERDTAERPVIKILRRK